MNWLSFALMTVACWGVYGIFLHAGSVAMADPVNGRIKAFLLVGVAYFITAVLAPLILLAVKGAPLAFWNYPIKGLKWSLLAGIVGAIGALGVLLAFGVKGTPTVVMSIIFAGAPVVNAVIAILQHPPEGGWGAIKWQFFAGIVLAALGGCLVTYYKPPPAKSPAALTQAASAAPVAQ
jgi:hypothetical protein